MPDNTIEWGQGAVNNTNDWGKAKANSTNNFGAIYDDSPSGDTNIAGGSPPTPALAQVNNVYSMSFDGTNDFIDSNSSPEGLVGSNNAYTVSAWVNPSASGNLKIVGAMDTGNRWYFRVLNGYASYAYGAATGGNDYQGTAAPITSNTWSNVIFTFDGSTTHKIYVNADLKLTQSSGSTQTVTSTKNLYIGALNLNGSATNFFNGFIDEIGIFNVALTAQEIQSIYNATETGKTADLNDLTTPPVKWYRMGD